MNDILYSQFCEMLLDHGAATPLEECINLLDRLDSEGRFPDIDYTDQQHNEWQVNIHFQRMVRLLSNRELLQDDTLRNRAMVGFDFWLNAGFQNPNWWHNDIGQPQAMGKAALLLRPWLTAEQMGKVLKIMERRSLHLMPSLYDLWVGANLLWGVFNTLQHAILAGDPSIAEDALIHAAGELTLIDGDRDGIKPDYSFFQHNTQLYSGGYGRSFVAEFARILFVLRGTSLQLPAEALACFSDYLLEGEQWMLLGESWDFNVIGREISRPEGINDPHFVKILSLLERVEELPRREELLAFFARVKGEGTPLDGDRAFPYGRLYISRRGGHYIGCRVTDPGQMMGETINAENYYSTNLYGGGVTCMMADPATYDHLPAVWDPCYMPGVTARVEDDAALMDKRRLWHGLKGANAYGRVLQLSPDDGVAYQDVNYNGITGVLSRFFADGVLIALGAGISADGPEPVVTALEQCRQRGASTPLTLPRGEAVYADGFLYAVLDGQPLHRREERRTGTWQRINESCTAPAESIPVRTLWLEHGTAPQNAAYAYAVVPGEGPAAVAALDAVEVLCNTAALQAIRVGGRVLAVFHKAGSLTLPDGRTVTGDTATAACFML